jgi:hypothetical protein
MIATACAALSLNSEQTCSCNFSDVPWFRVFLPAHSIRLQQLSLLNSTFATIISRSAIDLFDTDESRGFRDTPKEMTSRRAMEPQARNENASQAQRTNSDNPEKL